ncbi:MAG: 50S ribosomal protein L29 [Bryobacterales bacterium]|nr:50S ribosomal protein L29 [Bryobacterales bacterium]
MTIDKIRDTDTKELQGQQKDMQDQMFRLRFQMSMGQMDGMKKYQELRKDRARILTVLRQRELEAQKGAQK